MQIQEVELNQFGKDQLGSYPIHFHRDGDVGNAPLIDSNSIDHSYNKCISIHSTSNLTMQNNIFARIVGHIFYEELDPGANAASDSGINFTNNLGLGAMSNSFDINPVILTDNQQRALVPSDDAIGVATRAAASEDASPGCRLRPTPGRQGPIPTYMP